MKIAVTSQNFRTITGHAGKARRFLIYEASGQDEPREVDRLDLPMGMAFHDFRGEGLHPLDIAEVIVTGGCGRGFIDRMGRRGIRVVATAETDPMKAVRAVALGEPLPAAGPAH